MAPKARQPTSTSHIIGESGKMVAGGGIVLVASQKAVQHLATKCHTPHVTTKGIGWGLVAVGALMTVYSIGEKLYSKLRTDSELFV